MKKHVCLIATVSLLMSCKSYKKEFGQVSAERDSLIYVSDIKDSSLRSFIASFNEIESNLDTITHRENSLEQDSMMMSEVTGDQRDRINENIRIINRLLERNRVVISGLRDTVKMKRHRITELEGLTASLGEKVNNKEAELVPLKKQLDEKQKNLETLTLKVDSLVTKAPMNNTRIKEKLEKLTTGYYVAGTFKMLHFNSIVDMSGGFLGIGKNQTLKQDFKTDAFTKINTAQDTSISLNCRGAKVITNHPSDSYTLVKEHDSIRALTINDYERFWGTTKYLVIVRE